MQTLKWTQLAATTTRQTHISMDISMLIFNKQQVRKMHIFKLFICQYVFAKLKNKHDLLGTMRIAFNINKPIFKLLNRCSARADINFISLISLFFIMLLHDMYFKRTELIINRPLYVLMIIHFEFLSGKQSLEI